MSTGGLASWLEGLFSGTAYDLTVSNTLTAAAYGNAATEQIADADLEDDTMNLLSEVNTASGSNIESTTHDASIASVTIGSAAYVLDAADTVLTSAAAGGSLAKDILIGIDANTDGDLATTDIVLIFIDLASPVTPNGQNLTFQWSANGIIRLGASV